ncbi:unnamed protein product, partial [Iphiclides podalirius]
MARIPIEGLDEQLLVILRTWVPPTTVSSDDILCIECFVLLQEQMLSNTTPSQAVIPLSPALGHVNICFGCGTSIERQNLQSFIKLPSKEFYLKIDSSSSCQTFG